VSESTPPDAGSFILMQTRDGQPHS